jgi:hypothetical protein
MSGSRARVVLVACTLIFGFGVLVDLLLLMIAPMLFDAPGSQQSPYPWILVGAILLYPLLVAIGLGLGWRAYGRGEYGRAAKLALLPALAVALFVADIIALEVFCDGEFACREARR